MWIFSEQAVWVWQIASAAIQTVGIIFVILTLWYLARQIRLQRSSHIIQSIEGLTETWRSPSSLNLRRQVCQKMKERPGYFGNDTEEILEFFERLGMYKTINALPLDVIWEAFSWYIGFYYTLTEKGIAELRRYHGDRFLFENFELLAKEICDYSKEKEADGEQSAEEEKLNKFLNSEIQTANVLLGQAQ